MIDSFSEFVRYICEMTLQEIISISLLVATCLYTIVTILMWLESRKTRLQRVTPEIIAYLKTSEDHNVVMLVIENIGEGCGYDLKVFLDEEYHTFGQEDKNLSQLPIFNDGVSIYPPKYKLQYYLGECDQINKLQGTIGLRLKYSDQNKKNYAKHTDLKIKQIVCFYSDPPETYMGKIAYYLKEIDMKLGKDKIGSDDAGRDGK